jgi:hypothetical protein
MIGPARLSFAASAITGAIAIWSFVTVDAPIRRWVALVALPPILASLYQGAQYRRGQSANAFWPIAVYLFFMLGYYASAFGLYFLGVILQSTAWTLGRSEQRRREIQSHVA